MDENIFESGKKKLRVQKFPDLCGRGLKFVIHLSCLTEVSLLSLSSEKKRKPLHVVKSFGRIIELLTGL